MTTIREMSELLGLRVPEIKRLAGLDAKVSSETQLTAYQEATVRAEVIRRATVSEPDEPEAAVTAHPASSSTPVVGSFASTSTPTQPAAAPAAPKKRPEWLTPVLIIGTAILAVLALVFLAPRAGQTFGEIAAEARNAELEAELATKEAQLTALKSAAPVTSTQVVTRVVEVAPAEAPAQQVAEVEPKPDLAKVRSDLGLSVVDNSNEWDPALWVWNSHSKALVETGCPQDYLCTVAMADAENTVKMYVGQDDLIVKAYGASFRYLPSYPVNSKWRMQPLCQALQDEDAWGMSRTPAYHTLAGNFECATAEVDAQALAASDIAAPLVLPESHMTDIQAQTVLSLHVQYNGNIVNEPGLWLWNSEDRREVDLRCPEGWLCTLAQSDNTVRLYTGKAGLVVKGWGGSFRRIAEYDAGSIWRDLCKALKAENAYGAEHGEYSVIAGNFSCTQ